MPLKGSEYFPYPLDIWISHLKGFKKYRSDSSRKLYGCLNLPLPVSFLTATAAPMAVGNKYPL